jgi:hypothetical protein
MLHLNIFVTVDVELIPRTSLILKEKIYYQM